MSQPSDHLLRTLAAVPVPARVVDLGSGAGETAEALARLGFEVWAVDPDAAHAEAARSRLAPLVGDAEAARRVTRADLGALGFPDAWADWVVLAAPPPTVLDAAVAEAARVLRPGAWLWAAAAVEPDQLDGAAERAGLLVAEASVREGGAARAVYRRPGGAA
ncbi:class I SAM-dependent methyltransferase [Rubrivirga litoralis]|uniref:Class I SAM-dependent methyltransferase n=1 Tax=Rubrivirga litoralis TaxID=3075598 RepID=A0ABU3BPG5_9BACT|nr:class I SAM-dependent methyltransferase [Rubrivirga sp. F394]MDT0631185.1 class I SAM-dependent methyltransferase [Rubrivirga sp. F394]